MTDYAIKMESNPNMKTIWKDCLSIIKDKVPDLTYNTWFLPIKPIELNNQNLLVEVPSSFFIEWLEERYGNIIDETIKSVIGKNAELSFIIAENKEENSTTNISNSNITQLPTLRKVENNNYYKKDEIDLSEKEETPISLLNPRYTFENFIKGENNQLARAAALAIADNPGETSFNPLFIYGGVGLGKTHLIQAIGNEILQKKSAIKVSYLSADMFTAEFVDAIQHDKVNEFSSRYKTVDVLIIDDIQFLIGKEKTQDLFFQIFNQLHQSGKQIILSSDKPPKELKGLSERLVSRFQWGLTADIQPPDLETRIAILNKKSKNYGINISHKMIEYIALNITSNIRELEGCLIKLLANSSLSNKEIDIELVKRTVKEIATNRETNITIDQITKVVCQHFKVEENAVREKNRKKEVVIARQVAMYLSKKLTAYSLKTVGLHFGGRDHSTVIHAQTTIESLMEVDPQLKESVNYLKNKIEFSI